MSGVVRCSSIIAEDEVLAGRELNLSHRRPISDHLVWFAELMAVDNYDSFPDFNAFAGKADDPLDEETLGIGREPEDDYVASTDVFGSNLFDSKNRPLREIGFHGSAMDAVGRAAGGRYGCHRG
jgi:hypothetical protein